MSAASSKQIALGGLESAAEEERQIKAARTWREELYGAIREFATSYIDARTGARGYAACAAELEKQWGNPEQGRFVSAALLTAALKDSERNYFRAEWLHWFASQSQEVAEILARRVKPTKTDREFLDDVIASMREEVGHKLTERILRMARAR